MTAPGARRAVFLDRDGVLNRCAVRDGKPVAPRRIEDFRLLPGVAAATRALKQAGYMLIVVTNQPDIAAGRVDAATVAAMHVRLRRSLPLDAIEMCPHGPQDGCDCRKPKPGLLTRAARDLGISLADSVLVGDRAGDIAAGRAAGCRTIFIDRGYGESGRVDADAAAPNLPQAVRLLLGGRLARHADARPALVPGFRSR